MFNPDQLLSIGILRRQQIRDLPPFVFVKRDGLFVPFRAEQAVDLVGEEVFALRSDIRWDEEGELTWQDLVGFTIQDEQDGEIGIIDYIDESTINTLANLTDGRMVPLHEDFIIDIDTETRVLHVNLPFSL